MTARNLGYTDKWFEYGIVDKEFVEQQIEAFKNADDQNTEHYRYRAFLRWLRAKETFTDSEVENYIEIAKEDEDETMAGSAVKELLLYPMISNQQFEYIKVRLHEIWRLG